jgi:N-methylhydantoinase B
VVPVDPDSFDEIDLVTFGRGIEVPQPLGIFGGYPGGTVDYSIFRDIDLQEYLSTFSPPDTDPDSVEREDARWGVFDLAVDDMFRIRFGGSGGYGDPLERDADDVAADVKEGKIDVETARTVYGVPVTKEGNFDGSVDDTRDRLYSERLEDADSYEQPIASADTEPTGFLIGEYVTVVADETSGDKYAACRNCETTFASVEDNWKESVVVSESPVSAAGRHRDTPDNYCLREFVCPECGTLLDTEVADRDDPPLLNTVL